MATELINPNISFGEQRYLVRLNDVVVGMIDTEDAAVKAISSIASSEEKKLQESGLVVFRKYSDNNKEIQLHIQTTGRIFPDTLSPKVTVGTNSVRRVYYISPYADKIARFKEENAKRETGKVSLGEGGKDSDNV